MKSLFPPKDKISAYVLGLYTSDGYLRSKAKWSIYQSDEPFLQVIGDELTKRSIPNCIVKKEERVDDFGFGVTIFPGLVAI